MTTREIKEMEKEYQKYTLQELRDEISQTKRTGVDFEYFMSHGWEQMGFSSFEDYCIDFTTGYIETDLVKNLIKEREKELQLQD